MAIKLPKTDIVTIGLGGAAGVAVLPLAEAGRKDHRPRSRRLLDACRFSIG